MTDYLGRSGFAVVPLFSRHRKKLILLLASALAFLATGCRKPASASGSLRIACEVAPQPARVGSATITFMLSDAASLPVTGARIQVEADMTHAGMNPVLGDATEIQPGHYRTQIDFKMAGDWVILMHGTLKN